MSSVWATKLRQLAIVILLTCNAGTSMAQEPTLEPWQAVFLAELEKTHEAKKKQSQTDISYYSSSVISLTPRELLEILDARLRLRPYSGSMVDPAAALMGRSTNGLDRARLLAELLELGGHESRIMTVVRETDGARIDFPTTTSAPLQPISPELLERIEWQVQSLSPGIWQRLCGGPDHCRDWAANANDDPGESRVYWVQVRGGDTWENLIPFDTHLSDAALEYAEVFGSEDLEALRWQVSIEVANIHKGSKNTTPVLEITLPAGQLHGQPISYDNIPIPDQSSFLPTLSIGGYGISEGKPYSLAKNGIPIAYQLLRVTVTGPHGTRQHSRKLASPVNESPGLEMVTRGRVTILTGPVWEKLTDDQQNNNFIQLANLIYADPPDKDDRPLNLSSVRALSMLSLSQRLSGHVGVAGPSVFAYQGRPAIIFEKEYPEISSEGSELRTMFDILDPGHAFHCSDCEPVLPLQAAIEQAVLDGQLEQWVNSEDDSVSSHQLIKEILVTGAALSENKPAGVAWSDSYSHGEASYRMASTIGGLAGWRLDPGPQVVPILSGGQGGAGGTIGTSFTKSLIRSIIIHATSKCGASDITASIILSVMGAPMTTPLLSGMIGHMCRVAEAFNKAADAINCLEFMGNDCKNDPAKELERMLKGLGDALAMDLAVAAAMDLLVGAGLEYAVKPLWKGIKGGLPSKGPKGDAPPPKAKLDEPDTGTPKIDEPSTPPKIDEPTTTPKVDEPGTPPKADEPGTPAKTDKPTTPPKVDEPTTPPKTDEPDSSMFPEEFDPGYGPPKTEPAPPGRPMFDKPNGSQARGVQKGDQPDPAFTVVNKGTDTKPDAKTLRATQDHVYADDVNHHMGEMLSKGKDYDWGVGTPGGIKVDPNGKILDGHHRVLAAKRSGTDIPQDAIHWTDKPGSLPVVEKVDVRSGSKPRSEATYKETEEIDFQFPLDD